VRADVVEARGISGAGVKVAMVEFAPLNAQNEARVEVNNPYLTGTVDNGDNCAVSLHATLVAGIIRSTHPTERGIAPDVQLWAGGACAGNDIPLFEQAIAWGARVGNLSGGLMPTFSCLLDPECLCLPDVVEGLSNYDQLYDTLIFKSRFPLVVAAGNGGASHMCEAEGFYIYGIASPARAYNAIAVGAIDDLETPDWNNDCMMALSSWCDPFSTYHDREKPEVVAPGASIKSTLTEGPDWVGCASQICSHPPFPEACGCRLTEPNLSGCSYEYWGTSFAAPVVTGLAALMIQRSRSLNSALEAWPEAIKAILMATAIHNIEADTRLSECDGAGAVVADIADDVVRGVNGNWGAKEYDCRSPSPDDVATINLTAGQRVRVVIVWATDPGSPNYAVRPSADLDLLIVNSANQIIDKSVSYDNTYEIVDFVAPASGTYKIRVVRNHCEEDYPPSYLAWVWWGEAPQ